MIKSEQELALRRLAGVVPAGALTGLLFFVALAIVNELVWRTQTTDLWVKFKTFGFLPITLLFALAQAPLIMRYETKDEQAGDDL